MHYKRTWTAKRDDALPCVFIAVVAVTQEASFCLAGQSRWILLMRMYSMHAAEGRIEAQKSFYVKWTVRYQCERRATREPHALDEMCLFRRPEAAMDGIG